MGMKGDARKINCFDYRHVSLKNSHWKKQQDETIELYLNISNDDLLHYFRKKAGLKSQANGLSGWYGVNASTFGQKLAAFAKLYCVSGDYRLKEKALFLAEEWIKCADASPKTFECDTYVYDKLMGGFLDLYEYLGFSKIVKYMSLLTDYATTHFKKDIKRDGLQDYELWSNHMIEWYTLPENLYRAYQLIGDEKYKEFAKEWDYGYFWDKLNRRDFHIGPRHAYSHVNSLSSAARAYEVTGEEKYLSAMKIAYDEITTNHIFATGGYGPAECLFIEKEGYLGDSLKSTWDHTLSDPMYINFSGSRVTRNDAWGSCEIPCCAWAVFKFCNYLLQFTGDAKYGDWVEKMLYNGTGAQLPITPEGKVMYYANYFLDGAIKTVEDRRLQEDGQNFEWQCCTGTFPQDVAEYSNMLYYFDNESIYVSQYLPSKVEWKKGDTIVCLENYSGYPEESQVKLVVSVEGSIEFSLKLRVPSWANGQNTIKVNGKIEDVRLVPNTWATVTRVWNDGDIVTVDFPFSLYFKPVDKKNEDIVALNYGPLVLVTDKMTQLIGDVNNPSAWIHSVKDTLLTFVTDKGHVGGYDFLTRTFTPYYKVGEMQWYYMYNRIKPENINQWPHKS
ncbi:beta-L-arabinofuranosidase domain-containing protein [Geobacillus zalihae]|uniref:beta-L-arabinofuranosidase domain-containing protein n=1 Tax=Geobacillus zalihae TaxID=213419 RepID=UPI0009BED831|nr:beta-L-arabinofuranosidase domain-containing protein [Geobacillus zalihae]OQP13218.1 hypothetical protein B1693_16985 [Geobacillus zalihae]